MKHGPPEYAVTAYIIIKIAACLPPLDHLSARKNGIMPNS